jgi:hypothetical protein
VANNIAMNITSKIVALSSAVAFALQIALALLMLRYFSPEEVGVFSVISQIGFFWTTLALAQTPLRLLANHGASVFDDARQAWVSSLKRFVWLLPFAALAVWWSGLSFVNALLWALLLSLCQLTWMLAQCMRLRMKGVWAQAGVRVLPPMMALLVAVAAVFMQWSGPALLAAALLGYGVGAAWLLPSLLAYWQAKFDSVSTTPDEVAVLSAIQDPSHVAIAPVDGDNRSATLRMAHTLADALLATAIVVVWQRMYGAQETGWMAAPLRLMGFMPAVVHMAWVQVLLAQPQHARTNPLLVGLAGFASVALLGAGCAVALEFGWLGEQWQGVWPYLLPLVLWQGSACLAAAFSHLPFESQNARRYSWVCIGVAGMQCSALLAPVLFLSNYSAKFHVDFFGIISSIIIAILAVYLRTSRKNQIKNTF